MDGNVLRVMRRRPSARTWLTLVHHALQFDDLACAAGIEPLGDGWVEIDADQAEEHLAHILSHDLVHDRELLPQQSARWFAEDFIKTLGANGARFATNISGCLADATYSWRPATRFAVDAGVVILAATGSAIYWVADED
ncbi:hypothetical protein F0U44_13145 [Nocardioides humilatus]|uniref:Uncharacterized protein n=1 Tax=Nocardioides humilatus TaxID=2607660 RepID=A0A5B1LIG5_9ACTN|nr:hypothetical protein [Nocardioides humilatus]KAA1419377.1 hypothetical protein F0U44_13145 [Nocardioides humilatus]